MDQVSEQINFYHPDIIGIQEDNHFQIKLLELYLPDYCYIGMNHDDCKSLPERRKQAVNFSASCDMGQIGTWACFHPKSLPFDFLCSILMLATSNSEANKKTPKMFICKV